VAVVGGVTGARVSPSRCGLSVPSAAGPAGATNNVVEVRRGTIRNQQEGTNGGRTSAP